MSAVGLLNALASGVPAQNAKGPTGNKKPPAQIRPARGDDEPVNAPAPSSRSKSSAPQTGAPATSAGAKNRQAPAANGDEADDGDEQGRLERPDQRPLMRVEKLDPEMERILIAWEAHSAQFKRLAGNFLRRRYENVHEIEFWAEGRFVYQAPDKGYYELNGATPDPKKEPKRNLKNGEPYERKADQSEKWVCNGERLFKINDKEKKYEAIDIPEEQRGQNIIDGPLPFLFGMKVEQAKRRYVLQLLKPNKSYPDDYQINVLPRRRDDAANWSEARVILGSDDFLPRAVILNHPGNSETVHIFKPIEVNENNWEKLKEIFGGDPFKPKVRGYKLVDLEAAGPSRGEGGPPSPSAAPRPNAGAQPGRATSNERRDRDPPRSADASPAGRKPTAPR
ncbi:MAG: hypothetical protein ACT4QC_20690 [Planctomycetaceae bacterium]